MLTSVNQSGLRVSEVPPRVYTSRVIDGGLAPSYMQNMNTPLPAPVLRRREQSNSESLSSHEAGPINKHETRNMVVAN